MTVALTAGAQRYIGLSSDSKPAAPRAGATFYETDTLATYIFDGSAWSKMP